MFKYSGISLKRTSLGPKNSVRLIEVSALQRLLLIEFYQETTKLGQNLCPFYKECPLCDASLLEGFHCILLPLLAIFVFFQTVLHHTMAIIARA